MIVALTLALAIWLWLVVAHGQFWKSGPVLPRRQPLETPAVAIVVPARDEAEHIEATLRSLLAQDYAGRFRVILVDDNSTDGTGDIARTIKDDRLQVITGAERPPGWSGKLWAVSQGVGASSEPVVLLTDADITHSGNHLSTLIAQMTIESLDMVSEMVALRCRSWAERALIPAFVYFFQLLYPFNRVNDVSYIHCAAAAGGTVLIRRATLERIGGIESIRGALIDDVTLAKSVKIAGRIWLGHSELAMSMREYPGPRDIERMIARTAYVQLDYQPALLVGTVAVIGLVWLLPPLAAIFGHGVVAILGLLSWVIGAATYWPSVRRYRQSPLWLPGLPLVALFYVAATVKSAIDHYTGRGVAWKGRAYAEGAAKGNAA